jgi:hypothetical protein
MATSMEMGPHLRAMLLVMNRVSWRKWMHHGQQPSKDRYLFYQVQSFLHLKLTYSQGAQNQEGRH